MGLFLALSDTFKHPVRHEALLDAYKPTCCRLIKTYKTHWNLLLRTVQLLLAGLECHSWWWIHFGTSRRQECRYSRLIKSKLSFRDILKWPFRTFNASRVCSRYILSFLVSADRKLNGKIATKIGQEKVQLERSCWRQRQLSSLMR